MDPNQPSKGHADDLKAHASGAVHAFGEHVSEQFDYLQDRADIARHDTQVFIETNPWESVAVALGVGFVLGVAVSRTILRSL